LPVVTNVYVSLVRNHQFKIHRSKQRDTKLAKLDKDVKSEVEGCLTEHLPHEII